MIVAFICFLKELFNFFGEMFSDVCFIFGVKIGKNKRNICKILNFLLGQAKLTIYATRKRKIEQNNNIDVLVFF